MMALPFREELMAEIILFQYSFKLHLAPVGMMYIQVYSYQLHKQCVSVE